MGGSKIHGSPEPTPIFQLERAFPQLNFTDPVELTWAPEFKRFMLVELGTKVHLFANDPKATDTTVLLDLKAAKPEATRVYSFTLHPQFVRNRRAYMVYNYQIDKDKRVARVFQSYRSPESSRPIYPPNGRSSPGSVAAITAAVCASVRTACCTFPPATLPRPARLTA